MAWCGGGCRETEVASYVRGGASVAGGGQGAYGWPRGEGWKRSTVGCGGRCALEEGGVAAGPSIGAAVAAQGGRSGEDGAAEAEAERRGGVVPAGEEGGR